MPHLKIAAIWLSGIKETSLLQNKNLEIVIFGVWFQSYGDGRGDGSSGT